MTELERIKKNNTTYIASWAKRQRAILYMGGKCNHCDCTDIFVMDFHHIDPNDKEKHISKMIQRKWFKIKKELDKCILLCSNCHALFHFKNKVPHIERINKRRFLSYKKQNSCENCGWDKEMCGLQFHHRDKSAKLFEIYSKQYIQTFGSELPIEVKLEIDKCTVLCSNCHRKEHIDMARFAKFQDKINIGLDKYLSESITHALF